MISGNNIKELKVDLIIPVYRPDDKFNKLLNMIDKQTIRPKNILILKTEDNLADKEELKIPELSVDVKIYYIAKEDFDHGGTRRFGASLSDADILMYMTQDAVPADEYLIERLLEPYEDNLVSATYARQLPDEKADLIERYTRKFNYPSKSMVKSYADLGKFGIKTYFCSNVCATYRRDAYEKLGGFVERTIFNEDMIMAYTMIHGGYKIAYQAEAKVIHSHVYSYLQQFSRNFDLGVSHRQYADIFLKAGSESEGIRLVKNSVKYLIDKKRYLLIPDLIMTSGFKYLGYRLGLMYHKLPMNFVIRCSMNKNYWKKNDLV